ncbi:MAG: hypothetical protein HY854_07010 [Burkholderiales bacterium]|nr:hypothetical protein [Burkholderiales bacterium]
MTRARPEALQFIVDDCERIEDLFARRRTAAACVRLLVLTRLEQELLLPAARECSNDEDVVDEADAGVDQLRELVAQVLALRETDPLREPKSAVLANCARRHFMLLRDTVLPPVRSAHPDVQGLARGMQLRKAELEAVTEALREEVVAMSLAT